MQDSYRRLLRLSVTWAVLILIFAFAGGAGEAWSMRRVLFAAGVATVLGAVIALLLQLLAGVVRSRRATPGNASYPVNRQPTTRERVTDFFVTAIYLTLLNYYGFSKALPINRNIFTCVLVSSAAALVLALFRDKIKAWVKGAPGKTA